MKYFLLPEDWDGRREITLTGRDYHYLRRVRRYRVGDAIPCRGPDGAVLTARVAEEGNDSCLLRLEESGAGDASPSGDTAGGTAATLIAAVTKGRKMDLTVRQAVEAGAVAVWPVYSRHAVVRSGGGKGEQEKADRWRRIAREATQQSGAPRPPEIAGIRPLRKALEVWGGRGPLLVFHQTEVAGGVTANLHTLLADPPDEAAIMVGPEGGWSVDELELFRHHGASFIRLGARVLRSETAALYAMAAVQTILREGKAWRPARNV